VTRFAELPDLVLGPLAGRADADWYRAPAGKWCPAQIVEHLALGLDTSSRVFDERRAKPPMTRRPRTLFQRLAYVALVQVGWWPPGRKAPEMTRPAERPDRAAVERKVREAVDRFQRLERELLPARAGDLFVKHPVLGDLTIPEWMRFHVKHARHHAKQIVERLASSESVEGLRGKPS
jgi:uncharacterized protein DUF1569